MKTSSLSINRWSSRPQLMNERAKNPPLTSSSLPGHFTRESKTPNKIPQQAIDPSKIGRAKGRLKQAGDEYNYYYLTYLTPIAAVLTVCVGKGRDPLFLMNPHQIGKGRVGIWQWAKREGIIRITLLALNQRMTWKDKHLGKESCWIHDCRSNSRFDAGLLVSLYLLILVLA